MTGVAAPPMFLSLRDFLVVLGDELEGLLGPGVPARALLDRIGALELPAVTPTPPATGPELSPLSVIGLTDLAIALDGERLVVDATLDVLGGYEPAVPVPGLPDARLFLRDLGSLHVELDGDGFSGRLGTPAIALRFPRSWLRPATGAESEYAELTVHDLGFLLFDSTGGFELGNLPDRPVRLTTENDPWLVGETGLVLETGSLAFGHDDEERTVITLTAASLRSAEADGKGESSGVSIGRLELRLGRFSDALSAFFRDSAITIDALRIVSPLVPGNAIAGDVRLAFRGGHLDTGDSYLRRYEPDPAHLVPLDLKGMAVDRHGLVITWTEPRVSTWLGQLLPGLAEQNTQVSSDLTVRVLFGTPVREIRIDWAVAGVARTFQLPGFTLTTPSSGRISLILGAGEPDLSHAALTLTLDAGAALTAATDFALGQPDGSRELHSSDQDSGPPKPSLVTMTAKARENLTVVLLDWRIGAGGLPTFFRQTAALAPIDPASPDALVPTPYQPRGLHSDAWDIQLRVALKELPFLRALTEAGEQAIRIDLDHTDVEAHLGDGFFRVHLGVIVVLATVEIGAVVPIDFHWEKFAFDLGGETSLRLLSANAVIESDGDFLGLGWRLRGTPVVAPEGRPERYHYFTLLLAGHHVQLRQAPGAKFEVEYRELSEGGIVFAVSDFALAPTGVSLTATVTDQPAKLNGIDTRFRFNAGQLVIRNNGITDFTLSGSGPLPPALVGDGTAEISLQLGQRNGRLTLVEGRAHLQSRQGLYNKGTRFRFQVDALDVKFVYEQRFHLYFTLTGSAQYAPAEGDGQDGALALLGKVRIDLVDCPLVGDARVLAKHIQFMVELPRPVAFGFLGAFDMEIRGIGFIPQADVFAGDPAMLVAGQLKFAQGLGDTPDARTDVHKLYIAPPRPGGVLPRLHFGSLPVNINIGAAFRLNGVVEFVDTAEQQGFSGEGVLEIHGLPPIAASLAFLRVRRDASSAWLRAWFIYLEVRKVSFMLPVVQIYLREVGLGFGYRYTLTSIRAADQANDVRKLLAELKVLSRTQGDLSKRDRWAVDLEEPDHDPRFTIALRALISQTSAAPGPLRYEAASEQALACLFLLDAVIALRSDLTFFMAARAWLFANYDDYLNDRKLRENPPVSGFVLLSPRQKRLLANVSSNPGGQLGSRPALPAFVKKAVEHSQFTATLLVEPGLLHTELGWPNMLRWSDKLGPLEAELRGGFIFRVSRDELVIGTSFLARAKLELKAELSLGFAGVRVQALASVAYGARYIGLADLRAGLSGSAFYGGIGIEARILFAIEAFIRIKIGFIKIQKSFRLSMSLDFTAGIEVGLHGSAGAGLRGDGTLAVRVLGRSFHLRVHVGLNEDAVTAALERTRHVLDYGLEATEVEPLPGVAGQRAARRIAPAVTRTTAVRELAQPGYTAFQVAGADGYTYFVLFPAGERPVAGDWTRTADEPGFLPVPPVDEAGDDFVLSLPDGGGVERFDPSAHGWVGAAPPNPDGSVELRWRADWDGPVGGGDRYEVTGGVADEAGVASVQIRLRDFLAGAYVCDDEGDPVADPAVLPEPEELRDGRVQNPTDNAFEAAVRGAAAQFRGSPLLRRDRSDPYEAMLEAAFDPGTTVYRSAGTTPDARSATYQAEADDLVAAQQAHQLRGLIVQDIVADLREYAAAPEHGPPQDSPAFRMGLVFRTNRAVRWLADLATAGPAPVIRQRTGAGPGLGEPRPVRSFNPPALGFGANPPQFRGVCQLTDATTIAIAWELAWPEPPGDAASARQRDPEQHLVHYLVRRRAIDGDDREVTYTVKSADALHRHDGGPAGDALTLLRPRFQIVDHFVDERIQDLAALPATGRSYLYTITPVDFAGGSGRPLTIVATRYPDEPPVVPVDTEATVVYRIDDTVLDPATAGDPAAPTVVEPAGLTLEWSEPAPAGDTPVVPVAHHVLVFRREQTVPIGSYGLDSSTQRSTAGMLPTTNARPLPTDVRVELAVSGPRERRRAVLDAAELRRLGVLPGAPTTAGPAAWRPEAWRLFLQTVSINEVSSALAPVGLLLRIEAVQDAPDDLFEPASRREERRPAELEWLARPVRFPVLPPEDQRATQGAAHVPMPPVTGARFVPDLSGLGYRPHPAGLRCVRFEWNQGPSARPGYPVELHAGFRLLELDVDAHTDRTFSSAEKLAGALRLRQDVQLLPADELAVTPSDTLVTSQWEAWYPSTVARIRPDGAAVPAPWWSWRESYLDWPDWPELMATGRRTAQLHPALRAVLAELTEPGHEGLGAHRVDAQAGPPIQPQDLAGFTASSAAAADPYGWGVLHRLGLSTAFVLRRAASGELLTGQAMLDAVHAVLTVLTASGGDLAVRQAMPYLHVELLFRQGTAIRLGGGAPDPADLSALIQLSLRPLPRQYLGYARLPLAGLAGEQITVVLTVPAGSTCSVVDQGDPGTGQRDLSAAADNEVRVPLVVRVPLGGTTALLLRGNVLPAVGLGVARLSEDKAAEFNLTFQGVAGYSDNPVPHVSLAAGAVLTPGQRAALARLLGDGAADRLCGLTLTQFTPTDQGSTYFHTPVEALATSCATGDLRTQWARLRCYLESLNSTDDTVGDDRRIHVPITAAEIKTELPDHLLWAQRFFDHGPPAPDGEETAGPWVACAYPRVTAPAHAAADTAGRLRYDHLVPDPWAHAYRYYVRPYGRYDLLWQALRQSPAFPGAERLTDPPPDPGAGGLDVVLDRIRPVAAPVVLASTRLDPPAGAEAAIRPGPTWEVLVAQHPEQSLTEHNQTLARQLAYRHLAVALSRTFAYPDWPRQLGAAAHPPQVITLQPVADHYPDPPSAYPPKPDHLNLSGPLTEAEAVALDLPARLAGRPQGALAIQWEGLPFYYQHRLLLVAQTSRVVSAVNEIVQRDFDYRTPDPVGARLDTADVTITPPDSAEPVGVRSRVLDLPLCSLWSSVPPEARRQWPREEPDGITRRPAWLPDPGVVYQVVVTAGGNTEIQAEVGFDPGTGRFTTRQLGSGLLAEIGTLTAPEGAGVFRLAVLLHQITRQELSRTYSDAELSALPAPTRAKVRLSGTVLLFAGPITHADRDHLAAVLDPVDGAAMGRLHDDWYTQVPVSGVPEAVPSAVADNLDFPEPVRCPLVFDGTMTGEERTALLSLPGDPEFTAAVRRLVDVLQAPGAAAVTTVVAPLGPEQVPSALRPRVSVHRDAATWDRLSWHGNLDAAQAAALTAWPQVAGLATAVRDLVAALDLREQVADVPPPRPLPEELPPSLTGVLLIDAAELGWTGPAPTAEQNADLDALAGDDGFRTALAALRTAIRDATGDAPIAVPMSPIPRRPRQQDLPSAVADQLFITPRQVRWTGRVYRPGAEEYLADPPGDEPFRQALLGIRAAVDAQLVSVPMALPARPGPAELGVLGGKLLIGRAVLRWHGLMTRAEVPALQDVFDHATDRRAVTRLHEAAQRTGLQGRDLKIRARRGAAAPSDALPVTAVPPDATPAGEE